VLGESLLVHEPKPALRVQQKFRKVHVASVPAILGKSHVTIFRGNSVEEAARGAAV